MQREGRQGPGEESQAFVWLIKLLLTWPARGLLTPPTGAASRAGGSAEELHLVPWFRLQKSRTYERDV